MTEREKFEKWLNTLDKQTLVTMTAKQARTIEELQAATRAALPEGWKLVPVEPTTEQYGGLARDIIQWMRFTPSSDQHSQSLIEWLKNMGNEIPSWLMGENEINHLSKHVLSKGTIAAIIYKAMLEAAPDGDK
jgi:hypothetical protein